MGARAGGREALRPHPLNRFPVGTGAGTLPDASVEEPDYDAQKAWEAEWECDPTEGDVSAETSEDGTSREEDDGPTEAIIPTTDGPALVDLMRMSEDEWDAYTRGSAIRRAGYSGLRRNVAIALGNWLAASDAPDPEAVGELVAALSRILWWRRRRGRWDRVPDPGR